ALDENNSLKAELELSRKIQKQTQLSYNQSTERLRARVSEIHHIFDNSQFGIFRTSTEGKLFLANPALLKIIGYNSLDAINKVGLPNIYQHRSDREKLLTLAKQGPVREFETTFIRSDGAVIDTLITLYPMMDEDGQLKFLEGNLTDITEKKLAARELHNLRIHLSRIIDSMPSILMGVDTDGMVTLWNKTAEQNTGLSAHAAKGKYLAEIFPGMSSQMERIAASISTEEVIQVQEKAVFPEEGTRCEDITIFPLIGDDIDGAVIRIDDVSKECELEEQLSHSRKMDAIGQLAGGIAHDFNNVLGAIIGAAELLQSPDAGLDSEASELVDMILQAGARAADLTAKLLAFGRKGKITTSVVDIHEIIDNTVSILASTIDKIITISVHKEAAVHTVVGDASGLHNALINMGINASHAMPDGGSITISTGNVYLDNTYCEKSSFEIEPGEYVEIQMRDTGCGIPGENIRKIFEPFFTTSEQESGTGLGLAAVYGTVQDHQGSISVYSEEGRGSVFKILLPCSYEEADAVQINPDVVTGSGRILLVDDEELIRTTGKLMLEEMGYTVLLAENGRSAVELFKQVYREIDLVVMDMVMPEMNGGDAFEEMRRIDPACKVIISSGFSKSRSIDELKKSGLSGFIQKPFRNSKLSQLVAKVLSN
ncbi:MAG: PAS domain S-box protein, partial [Candidatus Fermentibacteraceae bacterium]|nr:PAS domain S-box protein [Candidatus Fermentibacteraceae bacterium]